VHRFRVGSLARACVDARASINQTINQSINVTFLKKRRFFGAKIVTIRIATRTFLCFF